MENPVPNGIVINVVNGGTQQDQNALMGCYFFMFTTWEYDLYDKNNKVKSTAPGGRVNTGRPFRFIMDGCLWTIYNLNIDRDGKTASGNWSNDRGIQVHLGKGQVGEDNNFTAQAGSNMDAKAASSAKA